MLNFTMSSRRLSQMPVAPSQRGIVLMIAMVVLVAMTLVGIGLMRSVYTSNRVAGNLAFQQSATQSADVGIETAIAWLEASAGANLYNNSNVTPPQPPAGYFAVREDPTPGQSWEDFWASTLVPTGNIKTLPTNTVTDYTVSYVIHRLCSAAGDPASGIDCSVPPAVLGADGNSLSTEIPVASSDHQYYRITARVTGPRNTVGFVQAVVAM